LDDRQSAGVTEIEQHKFLMKNETKAAEPKNRRRDDVDLDFATEEDCAERDVHQH